MAIVLGPHQYGKAENRIVRFVRDTPRHEIRDVNVTTTLRGAFDAAYLEGDQRDVLPTDTQKNTAYAFAKTVGLASIEDYAIALGTHFVAEVDPVAEARVEVEEYLWQRAVVDGVEHDHTWVRGGSEIRTAAITVTGAEDGSAPRVQLVGGLKDLVILKSTGSEFAGFMKDGFTTLPETHDRVMATSLVARWRFDDAVLAESPVDWDAAYAGIRAVLVREFATLQSLALQQTLWHMSRAVLAEFPAVAEVRLLAPNKHHFLYDLERFGIENHGEVFHADDRPYGLIQGGALREEASEAGSAWATGGGFA